MRKILIIGFSLVLLGAAVGIISGCVGAASSSAFSVGYAQPSGVK